jgi:hypothetical protein
MVRNSLVKELQNCNLDFAIQMIDDILFVAGYLLNFIHHFKKSIEVF